MTRFSKTVALVAARSGTGKTTVLEVLVTLLKEKGYRVGAVKHSGHAAAVDVPGSDSWRFSRAGADVTVLATKNIQAVFRAIDNPSLDECVREASQGTDIVLVEGFKDMAVPKIEIFRSGYTRSLHCRGEGNHDPDLVAVASDVGLDLDVPVLDLNDPAQICDFIIESFIEDQ